KPNRKESTLERCRLRRLVLLRRSLLDGSSLLVSKALRGLEARGPPCGNTILKETVNLLKRETLSFLDEEEDKGNADEAARAPDEEDLDTEVGVAFTGINHVRGGITDGD